MASSQSSRSRVTLGSFPTNPNFTWFVVIEGGGWVGVGEERTRIQAGEAVAWPPDVIDGAWTDGTQMRAIVVEFEPPRLALPGIVDADAGVLDPVSGSRPVGKGEGELAPRPAPPGSGRSRGPRVR